MPVYEYRCPQCDNRFETFHGVDAQAPRCPRCGATPRRVYGSIGIVFRGSGFHVTDYRRREKSSGDGAASEGKTSAKSDGPEARKETAKTSD
ncbi:MAG: zinc ribbon domain-containing protein [Armatimonadota bacterium]|nr:zinc ribbon domain-containing protein [Armatimonadota bacterium]MDR5697626.1 zinc ribbon domain-containing protein [Armatimonadota bacterium]